MPASGCAYDFNDMFGIKLGLQNGLYTGPVGIGPKTFLGGFYVKPDKKTSLAFLGFVGPQFGNVDLCGGSFIGSRQLMESHNVTIGNRNGIISISPTPIQAESAPRIPAHGGQAAFGWVLT